MKTVQILQELVRVADLLMGEMTPDEKLNWLQNLSRDQASKLFEKNPHCMLPIKYMDADVLQPYFVVCNRMGVIDGEVLKYSVNQCKELIGSSKVDQEHLLRTLKRLIKMYKLYSAGGPVKCPKMAYLKGKATQRMNSLGMAVSRI